MYKGTMDCFGKIVKEEGPTALFKVFLGLVFPLRGLPCFDAYKCLPQHAARSLCEYGINTRRFVPAPQFTFSIHKQQGAGANALRTVGSALVLVMYGEIKAFLDAK